MTKSGLIKKFQEMEKLFLVVLIILVSGCTNLNSDMDDNSSAEFLTYKNIDYKIEMNYPSSWAVHENTNSIVTFKSQQEDSSDRFLENLNLQISDLSENSKGVEEYTRISISQLSDQLRDFEIIESRETSLDNNEAFRITFLTTMDGTELKIMQVWTIKNDIVYILTFAAETNKFDKFAGDAEKIIQSFRINPSRS